NRLLHIDILARLRGPDAGERVPMVRRGDHHRVDFFALEHLPHVRERLAFEALSGEVGAALVEDTLIHIAERGEAHAFRAEEAIDVRHAAALEADGTDADIAICAFSSGVN